MISDGKAAEQTAWDRSWWPTASFIVVTEHTTCWGIQSQNDVEKNEDHFSFTPLIFSSWTAKEKQTIKVKWREGGIQVVFWHHPTHSGSWKTFSTEETMPLFVAFKGILLLPPVFNCLVSPSATKKCFHFHVIVACASKKLLAERLAPGSQYSPDWLPIV